MKRIQSQKIFLVLFFLGAFLSPIQGYPLNEETIVKKKGLFIVQFSWNQESFSNNLTLEISYRKSALLGKQKNSGKNYSFVKKNGMVAINLTEGEYELLGVNLKGKEIGFNKKLQVPINRKFTIKSGKVTNGGLFFIGKENKKSETVYSMTLNNTEDAKRYVEIYHPEFRNGIKSLKSAWKFIDDDRLNLIIKPFTQSLVARENKNPRANLKYMFTTLGIMIKLEKDASGKIVGYDFIKTPSYQEIVKAIKKDGKLLCTLGNGDLLYGTDQGLDYMPLPKEIEVAPKIYQYGKGKFLLVDHYLNIFSADETFNWKKQLEFKRTRRGITQSTFPPIVYMGKKNMYIYTTGSGPNKNLLYSSYDNINFKEVSLPKEIKKVPLLVETTNRLIIGPILKEYPRANKPAYLHVKQHIGSNWETVALPQGDCNEISVDPNDDDIIYVSPSRSEIKFRSKDGGKTWSKL